MKNVLYVAHRLGSKIYKNIPYFWKYSTEKQCWEKAHVMQEATMWHREKEIEAYRVSCNNAFIFNTSDFLSFFVWRSYNNNKIIAP